MAGAPSSPSPCVDASDAVRWWRAYVLADNDEADQLRALADAGDDHARRELASWLSDRARTEEAIEVIRPLADSGDDVAELWLVRWLAEGDQLDELRQRTSGGSYYAPPELARLLAEHDMYDELRERSSSAAGNYALHALARRLAERDMRDELRELAMAADLGRRALILQAAGEGASGGLGTLRLLADLGEKRSRIWLARRLAREGLVDELRQRAASGDEYAQQQLDAVADES
jgi:hypothetical protein